MAFKTFGILQLAIISVIGLCACSPGSKVEREENVIGLPVEKISSMVKVNGGDSDQIAVFDEVTRKIHQFRLSDMHYLRSFSVASPEKKHVLVAHDKGNYVIDIWDQHLEIFDKTGAVQIDPIDLVGTPVSVAFRQEDNLFVLYDNLNNVSIIRFDSEGQVEKTWIGGSVLGASSSITSGDLVAGRQLLLSLSDGSLAVVDVDQTLLQQKWVFTNFNPGIAGISWIAPVLDNPDQVLVKGQSALAIVSLNAKATVTSLDLSGLQLEKLSKSSNAHIIGRPSFDSPQIQILYPQNSQLVSRTLQKQGLSLLSSHLDLVKDRWSFIEISERSNYFDNSADQSKFGRQLKMLRPSDMMAVKKVQIVDQAQVLLSATSIFALFPSDLGYAVRYDLTSGAVKEAKFFNIGQAKP